MKNFKQYLEESGGPAGRWNQTPVSQNGNDTFDITNPEVLKRVNAFVGSIADREYLIPENAVNQLRGFLGRIGLTFLKVELPNGEMYDLTAMMLLENRLLGSRETHRLVLKCEKPTLVMGKAIKKVE